MEKKLPISRLFWLLFGSFMIFISVSAVGAQAGQTSEATSWLATNWAYVALLVSEFAGLVSGKFGGIVKAVITAATSIYDLFRKT